MPILILCHLAINALSLIQQQLTLSSVQREQTLKYLYTNNNTSQHVFILFSIEMYFYQKEYKKKIRRLTPSDFHVSIRLYPISNLPRHKVYRRNKIRKGTKCPIRRSIKERIILSLANLNLSNSNSVIPLLGMTLYF